MNENQLTAIRTTAAQMFPAGSYLVAERQSEQWRVRMFDLTRERAEDSLEWFTDASVFNVNEWDIQNGCPKL